MKYFTFVIAILLTACPLLAGEKEDIQKDVQIYQLQLSNFQLNIQLIQNEYPIIEGKLKKAVERLKELDKKESKGIDKSEAPK